MNNISNGGLVLRYKHKDITSDFGRYWYMNADIEADSVFFSDGTQGGALSTLNAEDPTGSVILNKPCANLTLNGDWLYYINEKDSFVYRCLRNGRSESLIIREAVKCFVVYGKAEILYAPVTGGIKDFDTGQFIARDVKPQMLIMGNKKLFYADQAAGGYLCCCELNAQSGYREQQLGSVIASSINAEGNIVYFTDALNNNAIYKLDTAEDGASPIKICGEPAAYLHIFDNNLYFFNNAVWKTLPLGGGAAKEVVT